MLNSLPEISFIDSNAADVESSVITQYETAAGRTLAPGDPVRLFLETIAAVIVQQREVINFAAKQNLLAYATGNYLDHLAAHLGVTRLPASAAQTTLRFTLSAAQSFAVLIPAGTRASPDGALIWSTDCAAQISIGDTYVDVTASCQTAGAAGNGYVAGQISQIVDPVAYVATVANSTTSSGGADPESDDALRERTHLAPESFSVAGPSGAYEYWAKTAHQGIIDVAVIAPEESPGDVHIYPLMTGGALPTQDILTLVSNTCSSDKVRPLTDHVYVESPVSVGYATSLTYYIARADATQATAIQTAVADAVAAYELWQRSKLGRDINPSELIRRVMAAGALRVFVTTPAHTVLTAAQVAIPSTAAVVTFGGLEDG